MSPFERDVLLEMAAELEARADKAASEMLAHKRRMLQLRQRVAVLRELASQPEPDSAP
jgi:hypothetical protein